MVGEPTLSDEALENRLLSWLGLKEQRKCSEDPPGNVNDAVGSISNDFGLFAMLSPSGEVGESG
jgi:hypothetical protein